MDVGDYEVDINLEDGDSLDEVDDDEADVETGGTALRNLSLVNADDPNERP